MRSVKIALVVVALLLSSVGFAEAQQEIFLVRYGDTVREKGNPDVPLSEAGERRTIALAALLKDSGEFAKIWRCSKVTWSPQTSARISGVRAI